MINEEDLKNSIRLLCNCLNKPLGKIGNKIILLVFIDNMILIHLF